MFSDEPLILTVEYRCTVKEVARALQYPSWGDPSVRRRLLLRAGTMLVAGIGCSVFAIALHSSWLSSIGLPLVLISIYWPLIAMQYPKGLAKIYAKQPRFKDSTRATVKPEALEFSSIHGELKLAWRSIREIVVTGEQTLLVLGRYQVIGIPWRCFEAPSAAQRFTELAREYWCSRKDADPVPLTLPPDVAAALGPDHLLVQYDLTPREIRGMVVGHVLRKRQFLLSLAVVTLGVGTIAGGVMSPFAGLMAAFLAAAFLLVLVMALAVYSASSSKSVMGPHWLAAGPAALWSANQQHGQSWTKWSNITQVTGNRSAVLLFRGPDIVTCIPRRCFRTSEEADHFLAQATRWRAASLTSGPNFR